MKPDLITQLVKFITVIEELPTRSVKQYNLIAAAANGVRHAILSLREYSRQDKMR